MTTVGVRELRQRASELLRQVARGETIEITDRGRPVALLGPVPTGDELTRLRAAGQVSAAEGDVSDLPEPLELEPGHQQASEVLARLRHDER
jgi:prevent-host-death family protein